MLYYPLKKLRRDPHIFFKILLFCLIAHVVILIFPLMKNLVHAPKRMAMISFMPRTMGAEVTVKATSKSNGKKPAQKKPVSKNQNLVKKEIAKTPVAPIKKEAKPVTKKIDSSAKKVSTPAPQNKAKLQEPAIKDGASSKLQLIDRAKKKIESPKIEKKIIEAAPKKIEEKKNEPIITKEPKLEVKKAVEPEPAKIEPIKEIIIAPELQTMALNSGIHTNTADEKDIPAWFTEVRDAIAHKILEYKFFKDIDEDFSYTALVTINAQGKASISEEAGCAIPVVRSSIKKIYLEYAYPKTMWNKIWPISIEKHKL